MTEPSLPLEPAEPAAPAAAAPEGPPATPPDAPKRTMSMVSLAVLAVAVVGGVAFTSLMMAARPGAHVRAAAAPAAAYNARPAAPGAARTPVVVDSASAPKWTSKHQARWAGTTRKTAVMEVAAERPVAVWNDTVTPLLIVRCMDKRTDVFVYTETAARIEAEDENHTVKIALDDDAASHERWPDSVEHDALFAPDGASLARRLMTAGTLRFSFTPHNAAPVTAVFNVHGLAEQLKPVAKHCGGLE
jgi:hypothetical protein